MKRTNQNIEHWVSHPTKTPKQIKHYRLTEAERLFVWLYSIIGYTIAESYLISHKSAASLNSCSAMGSRLMKSEHVVEYLGWMDDYFNRIPLEVKVR